MVLTSLLGALGGGILRIAPEIITAIDRGNERKHEREMTKLKGDIHKGETAQENQMVLDKGGLEALVESIKAQSTPSGSKFADGISAVVRPFLTFYWCIIGVTIAKIAQFYVYVNDKGLGAAEAITLLWGQNEWVIVSGMINFWFLDRVIRKNKGI